MISNKTVKMIWMVAMGISMLGGVIGAVLTTVMGFACTFMSVLAL